MDWRDPPATADGRNPTLRYQFSGKADEKAVDRNEAKWIGFEKSDGKDEGLMVDIEPDWLFLNLFPSKVLDFEIMSS